MLKTAQKMFMVTFEERDQIFVQLQKVVRKPLVQWVMIRQCGIISSSSPCNGLFPSTVCASNEPIDPLRESL